MRTWQSAIRFALAFAALVALSAAAAKAQPVRFISTIGNDVNPCSLTQPCRYLRRGINATPAGGELHILSSGGYGNGGVITKSMTIDGRGNTVTTASSPAIFVNNASAVVTLRDLHLNGRHVLDRGINVSRAATVHILNCNIGRFAVAGIDLVPTIGDG